MDRKAHVIIKGRVQGVFYREWIRSQAESMNLTGWVKNLASGKVEAVFEGPKEKVEEIIDKCKEGSGAARVENIDIKWEKGTGEYKSFEIDR